MESTTLTSSDAVFVQYNENEIMVDSDKDSNFEHQVEKGDVNCDGLINSVDATLILQKYAELFAILFS